MKYYLLLFTMLMGCAQTDLATKNNNYATQQWILEHRKPITCTVAYVNLSMTPLYGYTLRSADNQFYDTRLISLMLPDVINEVPDLKRDWMRELSENQNNTIGK